MRSVRRTVSLALAALVGSGAAVAVVAAPAEATLPTQTIVDGTARPLGPVTVIGDSVLLGSVSYAPTVVTRLAQQGWGPIRAQAGGGYSTGGSGIGTPQYWASQWITTWRSQGWDAPNVLVNLGANDSGWCSTTACAYDSITHLVSTIGPGRQIWWPKITRFYTKRAQQDAWNAALDRVAAERDAFFTWDWPTVMANGPFPSSDGTHLSPDGYRLRSQLMAEEFTADLAQAERLGDHAPLPTPLGEPTGYHARTPERLVDTRTDPPGRLDAGDTLAVDMTPHVPDGTTAVAVNLTSAGTTAGGFLSAHPCDRDRRDGSSVNHGPGVPRGALAIVPLSDEGELCVYTEAQGHVAVDLQGAFVPEGGNGFTPVDGDRLVDTRETGRENPVVIAIDDPAVTAVALNLTAIRGDETGYLTAGGCEGGRSEVSNVNFRPDEPVAGAAIVPVSADGRACVWSSTGVDVVVDLTGEFRDDGGLRFQPADPRRVLDLRDGTGGWAPVAGAGQLIDTRVAPAGAAAVTGTITLVRPARTGYAVADCRDDPPVSNVNARAGDVMANSLTVAVQDGGELCFRSSEAAKLLFDTTGWWVP